MLDDVSNNIVSANYLLGPCLRPRQVVPRESLCCSSASFQYTTQWRSLLEVNILIFFVGLSSFVFCINILSSLKIQAGMKRDFKSQITNLIHQDDEISIGQLGRDGYDCYSICVNDHLISSHHCDYHHIEIFIISYISEQQYLVPC